MFKFFTGFLIGFVGMLLYFNNKSSKEKNKKNNDISPFLNEDPYRIINIMKEYQKMREKI